MEDELTNEKILTHDNNYIRGTNKRTKYGYSLKDGKKSTTTTELFVNNGRISKKKLTKKRFHPKSFNGNGLDLGVPIFIVDCFYRIN